MRQVTGLTITHALFACLSGASRHDRYNRVNRRLVAWMGGSIVLGSLAGWGVLETTRANAADREATLKQAEADEARRSVLLVDLHQTRLSERRAGWSKKVLVRAR